MSEHQYKVGDRVRMRACADVREDWHNEQGEIIDIDEDKNCHIDFGERGLAWWRAGVLEPLPSPPPPVQSAEPRRKGTLYIHGQQYSYDVPEGTGKLSTSPAPEMVQGLIADVCNEIRDMLVSKNKAYGNAALDPVRIFSKADPIEQLNVRIDDKLSRLVRGQDAGEDVELDLMGYLVLKQVAKRLNEQNTPKTP